MGHQNFGKVSARIEYCLIPSGSAKIFACLQISGPGSHPATEMQTSVPKWPIIPDFNLVSVIVIM
jgi:hypothetical protein